MYGFGGLGQVEVRFGRVSRWRGNERQTKKDRATQPIAMESHIQDTTFENCPFIRSNFQLLINNSTTGYSTSALINNSLKIEHVKALPGGRILYFEIKNGRILPTGQWYAPSAVTKNAWYCMVLHGIALYCMVLHGIA